MESGTDVLNANGRRGIPIGKYHLLSSKSSHEPKKYANTYSIRCALLASLNSILLGYDIGVISGAILYIKDDLKIGEWQEEILVGSLNIVSLFGAAVAGRVADGVGRRWTVVVAAVFFFVGALVMGFAPTFAVLMSGRVFAGIGVGFALMIAPVYTAEVSPASSRGSLVSFPEIFINVGILLGYIASYILSGFAANLGWRLMLGFGVFPAVLLVCGAVIMPESPRWLVMQNRIEEAEQVLLRTSGDKAEADLRLSEIMDAAGIVNSSGERVRESTWIGQVQEVAKTETNMHGQGVWRELLWPNPAVRRMLILSLGIQFFQQATGIDATVYYSPEVFSSAGVSSKSASIGATVAVGFSKTVFILVATIWLDRIGRRPLLLASSLGMSASLAVLATGFKLFGVTRLSNDIGFATAPAPAAHAVSSFAPVLAVVAICCYVAFFSIGLGPVNWVLTSEIFPLRLRAQAMGLGVVVNRVASGTVALTFLSLCDALTVAGTFAIFAGFGILASVFIYIFVPETKGRTLEDIAKFFDRNHTPASGAIEMGAAGTSRNVGALETDPSSTSVQLFPVESGEEEDAGLMDHDEISIPVVDIADSRRKLLKKVKSIAKQSSRLL